MSMNLIAIESHRHTLMSPSSRFSGIRPVVVSMISAVLIMCLHSLLFAVPTKDTDISGDWNTGVNWDPDGVPVSGTDSVNIDLAMTVSANTSFGDASGTENSLWGAVCCNPITITAGNTLTHVSGSTLVSVDPSFIVGPGTFRNEGTFLPKNEWFLLWSGGAVFDNAGNVTYDTDAGFVEIRSGTQFNNVGTGTITIDMSSPSDFARVWGTDDGTGQFTNTAANAAFNFNDGILAYDLPDSGSMNDAAFANLFDATSLNNVLNDAQVHLTGGYDDVTLTGATTLDNVRLGAAISTGTEAAFRARPGGTSINVTNPAGIQIAQDGSNYAVFDTATGRTITNEVGSKIYAEDNTNFFHTGTGTFENKGQMDFETIWYLHWTGAPIFDNTGTINFNGDGISRFELRNNGTRFNNLPGGTININLDNATDMVRMYGPADQDAQFVNTGNPIMFQQGIFSYGAPNSGTLTDATFATLFDTASLNSTDSQVFLNGGFTAINLTGATDLDNVRLGTAHSTSSAVGEAMTAVAGNTTFNITHPDGIQIANRLGQYSVFNAPAGRKFINAANSKIVVGDGTRFFHVGDGSFDNEGTIEVQNGWFLQWQGGNHTVNNSGLVEFQKNGGLLEIRTGMQFNNTGTLRVDLPGGGDSVLVEDVGTFSNTGTVEVLGGELTVQTLTVPQVTASAINGGTWIVHDTGVGATLDFQASGTSPGSIDTIGSGAKVLMGGASPQFTQLSSASLNVDGTFAVHDSQVYGLTGNLNMGSGGVLEFGLQGLDEGGTLTTGIQIVGSVSFDDTQIDIIDLGGVGVGTYRIMEFASATGLAVLGDSPSGYNFGLIQGIDFLDLTVAEIPEPSSLLLLGLGALGLVRHTRRRMTKA